MFRLIKRKPKPYVEERNRLLYKMSLTPPTDDDYETLMKRLNELDKILNRTTELKKVSIPALGGVAAIGGIYVLQQFGGVIVPKAMDSIAARQEQKNHTEPEHF